MLLHCALYRTHQYMRVASENFMHPYVNGIYGACAMNVLLACNTMLFSQHENRWSVDIVISAYLQMRKGQRVSDVTRNASCSRDNLHLHCKVLHFVDALTVPCIGVVRVASY